MSPSVIRRLSALVLTVAFLVVALAAVAGCGSGGGLAPAAQETPYCVGQDGTVYPPNYCDGGSHDGMSSALFFYMLATWPHPYSYGQHISVTNIHVTKINAGDSAARRRYGMPARGPVSSGYRYSPTRTSSGYGTRTTTRTGGGSSFTRTTTTRSGGLFGGSSNGWRSGGGSSFRGGRK